MKTAKLTLHLESLRALSADETPLVQGGNGVPGGSGMEGCVTYTCDTRNISCHTCYGPRSCQY